MAFVLAIAACVWPAISRAQYVVELDLDDLVGNGPDTVSVGFADDLWVDVWLHGPEALVCFGVTVCNFDAHLTYSGLSYNLPESWSEVVDGFPTPGCYVMAATDFGLIQPLSLPWMVGTMHFVAAEDRSLGVLSGAETGWSSIGGGSGSFDSYVGAVVQIGSTGAEDSTWGSIKRLFR
jgi:hypothetical protein